ncbi:cutinase family protein [Candidatus Saccharibacteria bacterium]|nr:cutinase family protein [Candidatus Saccharibacteria bacterium]
MVKKLLLAVLIVGAYFLAPAGYISNAVAVSCPDLKIIFARGSGEERWVDKNYLTFKSEIESKLKLTNLKYEFEDLDYPAIGVGDPLTLLTTFVSGGEAYEFGESVSVGVKNLISGTSGACSNTKYILAGYSQGAMVVSKAINYINPNKIIYAATFGDPKIYLPEGFGLVPSACSGKNLSNYRIYVPDCRVYEGMLGGYKPYQPEGYVDKLGTWCNKNDIFCSTHFSVNAHTSYVSDGLYTDASKLIFDKICKSFGILNTFVSLHDTAILIDSTGSMENYLHDYKREALNLAEKTLNSGGRVALYDYRDLGDPYNVNEHCSFDTCTMDSFKAGLDAITLGGGGESIEESLLSASFNVMKKLSWKFGSTKSVVVFTDAGYHNPDIDGVTFADVVNLSKKIDPVNFYVVTTKLNKNFYKTLAEATDGAVTTLVDGVSGMTDNIMARYDSLPRVEEDFDRAVLPEIPESEFEWIGTDSARISWKTTGKGVVVALNDLVLGMCESDSITIDKLDLSVDNVVTLTPIGENVRGRSIHINLNAGRGEITVEIPKVPNAGKK